MNLFKLRGALSQQQSWILGVLGIVALLGIWDLMANVKAEKKVLYDTVMPTNNVGYDKVTLDSLQKVDDKLRAEATDYELVYPFLPRPFSVFKGFKTVYQQDKLVEDTQISIFRNLQGYFWAILIAVPLGFLVGLFPLFRGMFNWQIDALRYLPITALTGMFIAWFGIGEEMKVSFLAFGIIVYLLPVVIQRINEVEDIHLKTVFTLGASDWQTFKSVYLPAVFSKLSDDIRVLTAISWTYIIIAELLNRKGGLGALIFIKSKQGLLEEVFAILIIIILIGVVQDKIFRYLDKVLFPHKYFKQKFGPVKTNLDNARYGVLAFLLGLVITIMVSSDLAIAGNLLMLAGLGFIAYSEFGLYKAKASSE